MRRGAAAAVLLAACTAAAVFAWHRYHRDEARLRRAIGELAGLVSKEPGEAPLASAARARAASDFFAPGAVLSDAFRPRLPAGRDALAAAILHARARADRIGVTLHDVQVEVGPGRSNAVMRVTATASVQGGGMREGETREARLDWVRTDAGWRIARLAPGDALRPIDPP